MENWIPFEVVDSEILLQFKTQQHWLTFKKMCQPDPADFFVLLRSLIPGNVPRFVIDGKQGPSDVLGDLTLEEWARGKGIPLSFTFHGLGQEKSETDRGWHGLGLWVGKDRVL